MLGRRRQMKILLFLCVTPFVLVAYRHLRTPSIHRPINVVQRPLGPNAEVKNNDNDNSLLGINRTNDLNQVNYIGTTNKLATSVNRDVTLKSPDRGSLDYKYGQKTWSSDHEGESPVYNTGSSEHRKRRYGFRGENVVVWKKLENGTVLEVQQSDDDRFFNNKHLSPKHQHIRFMKSRYANMTHVEDLPENGRHTNPLHIINSRNISNKAQIAEWIAFDNHLKHRAATKSIKWDQEWLENFAGKEMIDLMGLTIVGKGLIPMRLKEFQLKPSMTGKYLEDLRNNIRRELQRMNRMQPKKPVSYDRNNLPIELYNLAPYLLDHIPHSFSTTTKNPCWESLEMSFHVLCLPYFYLIGAPKSATTDLWSKILLHPDVIKALDKEPQFWTRGNLVSGLLRYCANFMPLSKVITRNDHSLSSYISGDGTASNFWERRRSQILYGLHPDGPPYFTADLLRAIQPDAKIIVILREPTSRLYSEYLDLDAFWPLFKSPEDFHLRIENVISHFNKCLETKHVAGCASNYYQPRIQVGMYSVHIREWMKRFPPEQILVLRTEEWAQRPTQQLQRVYRFLNLTEIPPETVESFTTKKKQNLRKPRNRRIGEILPETRSLLNSFYEPFKEDLSTFLNDDKFLWK